VIWKRLVDPDCPDIPRPRFNSVDPETTELDLKHTQFCLRCMDFLIAMNGEGDPQDERGECRWLNEITRRSG
jgi:hypothetical protein